MNSTTVAQHTTQPLNFGPEWLRALSTPESSTPLIPSSGSSGNANGNTFKFSATKHRYSKEEILALRANVTERLATAVRNEIMANLKDIESVFRPNIIEPLILTTPTPDETAKMNALSSYISARTPGGGGRAGVHSHLHDVRSSRGGNSMSNGRGGSRARVGRDHNFGSNRGNSIYDDNGDNGGSTGGSNDTFGSWSRVGHHSRGGGGGSIGNRGRAYDDREQSQPFRRGGGTRQTMDGWRRSRGDDDENHDHNEDSSMPMNSSSTWTSRSGQTRRSGAGGSMEHRTKSNEKWNHADDRSGPSNSYESNSSRNWRPNTTMSDRDLNSRRPQGKREPMPEWVHDNNDDVNQLNSATFESDGTFTAGSSSIRQNNHSDEQQKLPSQCTTDDISSRNLSKQKDVNKIDKSTVINVISNVSETIENQSTSSVQLTSAWDNELEPNDVTKNIVESTLAEGHDHCRSVSTHRPILVEPNSSAPSMIAQQRMQPSVIIDDKQWYYKDPQNTVQGPFSSADMERWYAAGYFTMSLPVKRLGEQQFSTIEQLVTELGRLPFLTDISSAKQQQAIVSESQKLTPLIYSTASTVNNPYLDEYLMKQQARQNIQHTTSFNRQTSLPVSASDRTSVTSSPIINPQLQAYLASQQQLQSQSASSVFSSNMVNDPAIIYQQQPSLQRSISATNQPPLVDEMSRSFRQISPQSSFFDTNMPISSCHKPDDIITRLAQAMQSHGQQQQEKIEEQRRLEQHRCEIGIERLKLVQQTEHLRLQHEKDECRQLEQKQKLEDEQRKKKEISTNKSTTLEPMKDTNKTKDQKEQQQTVKSSSQVEIDPFIAFQQSLNFQKEQQAKIEAQKAENVRRYQQQLREQPQHHQPIFKLPETANWARHPSHHSNQTHALNFAEIQKQEQEQERRARDAAVTAQQLTKSEASNNSNLPSSNNKSTSWARTLFAGDNSRSSNTIPPTLSHIPPEQEINENIFPESPITSYNQQATNAPKPRPNINQQSTPWNVANNVPNTSLQDIQRQQQQQQQTQNETKQQQQHALSISSGHSTPAWSALVQHLTPSAQSSSTIFREDNQHFSSATKSVAISNNKSFMPWTDFKSATPSTKTNPVNVELSKSEQEAKNLFTTTRTQDALSKWTQAQFKDNLQAIDVPTLVQLLKDIESSEEIIEYVQPYIGSVAKAKEFANDFITKRKQLANAEPELDNESLHELAMAPTSSNRNSNNAGDEGFQLASSNGQKRKAKKLKAQKIDVKQLGFMVNNRPEQRDDIDKVPM